MVYHITPASVDYPYLLRTWPLEEQPELYCVGNVDLLNTRWVGFTGTRKATEKALETAFSWAHRLASEGYTIVSGGCRGIDIAAHQGAVEAGGNTIVVLPHAFGHKEIILPNGKKVEVSNMPDHDKVNMPLMVKIGKSSHGLLITQYKEGTVYNRVVSAQHKCRYHERNKIIASSLLLFGWQYPEEGSGTTNTLNQATRMNRGIAIAVPASISERERRNHWMGGVQYLDNHLHSNILLKFDSDSEQQQSAMLELIEEMVIKSRSMPQFSCAE